MNELSELIQEIVTAVSAVAPDSADKLNAPALEHQLSSLTDAIPQIPSALIAFLAIHNGEDALADTSLFPHVLLMDVSSILACYQDFTESEDEFIEEAVFSRNIGSIQGPVKPVFMYSKRIPFAWLNGGDVIWSLDLDPAIGGNIGQVVAEDQEAIDIRVIAPSLSLLFQQYLTDLKNNQFSEEEGQIVSDQWWPKRVLDMT